VRFQFEDKALACAGDGGGLDHASFEDYYFASFGVDFGGWARGVDDGGPYSGGDQTEETADASQEPGAAEERGERKREETAGEQRRFLETEGNGMSKVDPQRDGRAGTK
jgi:hypothetical protein